LAHHQPFQVTGFYSCDRELGLEVLTGKIELKPSVNSWDWLGSGIYFWEQNPIRALEYAQECADGIQFNNGNIKNPFVLGANIELGNCLNLVESQSLSILTEAYHGLVKLNNEAELEMPKNNGNNRALDCAVIKYIHQSNIENCKKAYDTIRCSFDEGGEVYPGATFTSRHHIQICVINPDMIKGFFLPRPLNEFNPHFRVA
jgi:hypothetical protein